MLAGIHVQYTPDEGELMKEVVSLKKPAVIFVVPALLDKTLKDSKGKLLLGNIYPEENFYKQWFIDFLKENRKNSSLIFAQEGYTHYCERCFEKFLGNGGREKDAWPDPFHEHVCLDGKAQSLEEQMESMKKGKGLLKDFTGIVPEGYCPPNHLGNQDTLSAAEIKGFKHIMTRNLLGLSAYYENSHMIVLPEVKLGERKNSPVISTYYDHFVDGKWEEFQKILESSDTKFEISGKQEIRVWLNSQAIIYAKKGRDLKKRLR